MCTVEIRDVDSNVIWKRQEILDTVLPVSILDAQKQVSLHNSCGEYCYIIIYDSMLSNKINIPLNLPF